VTGSCEHGSEIYVKCRKESMIARELEGGWDQSRSGYCGEEKHLTLPGIEHGCSSQ
jgi:hypothetical protein